MVRIGRACFIWLLLSGAVSSAQSLPLDGSPVRSSIEVSEPERRFSLALPSRSRVRIETRGATELQVGISQNNEMLRLAAYNGRIDSADLINPRLECDLPAGKYSVVVRHANASGVGEFQIVAATVKRLAAQPDEPENGNEGDEGAEIDTDEKTGQAARLWIQSGHTVAIECGCFARNQLAVTGAPDATFLWHVPTGREIRQFPAADVCDATDDGRFVLLGSEASIGLYNGATSKALLVSAVKQEQPKFAFVIGGADGDVMRFGVVSAPKFSEEMYFHLLEWNTEKDTGNAKVISIPPATSVYVDREQHVVWFGGADGRIRRFDGDAAVSEVLEASTYPIIALSVSGNPAEFCWVDSESNSLWRQSEAAAEPELVADLLETGQPRLPRFEKFGSLTPNLTLYDFVMVPNAKALFVSDSDGFVMRWDLESGQAVKVFQNATVDVDPALAISNDSSRLLVDNRVYDLNAGAAIEASDEGTLRRKRIPALLENVKPGPWTLEVSAPQDFYEPIVELSGSASTHAYQVTFDSQGASLYTALDDNTLRRCNLKTGAQEVVPSVAVTGRHFALLDNEQSLVGRDGVVSLYDGDDVLRSFEIGDVPKMEAQNRPPRLTSLSLSADSKICCATSGAFLAWFDPAKEGTLFRKEFESPFTDSVISANGKWVLAGNTKGEVLVFDVEAKNETDRLRLATNFSIRQVEFWNDEKPEVVALDNTGEVTIWRKDEEPLAVPALRITSEAKARPFTDVTLAKLPGEQRILLGGANGVIAIIDINKLDDPPILLDAGEGVIDAIAVDFRSQQKLVATAGANKQCVLWDFSSETPAELCRLVSIRGRGFFAFDQENRFDTDKLEDATGVHWVFEDSPFLPGSPALFQREYYEPSLVARKVANETFASVASISDLDRIQPVAKVEQVVPSASGKPDFVDVAVRVAPGLVDKETGAAQGLPFDLRVFRDGQLIGQYPRPGGSVAVSANVISEAGKQQWLKSYDVISQFQVDPTKDWQRSESPNEYIKWFRNVRIPRRRAGKTVEFSTYAFNKDRVRGEIDRVEYQTGVDLGQPKPRAFIISVGVNAYETPSWDLQYAANDAIRFHRVMTSSLLDYEVVSVPLVSDYRKDSKGAFEFPRRLSQVTATKGNVKNALAALAGAQDSGRMSDVPVLAGDSGRLTKATPDDLLILFLAGHGFTSPGGEFYFFPYDIGIDQPGFPTPAVLENAISSTELSQWLRDVDVGRAVMIIDACESAGVVPNNYKIGPFGSRGLGQLAYDKGMQVLAASQADEFAIEISQLQHGLLTYALVVAGISDKKAKLPDSPAFTLDDCLAFARDNVASLFKSLYEQGLRQSGDENDQRKVVFGPKRAIVAQLSEQERGELQQASNSAQRPSLFDFCRDVLRSEQPIRLRP